MARSDRQVSLTTPLGPDVLLVSAFTGREALSELFAYELDLVAPNDTQVPFEALLGQPATVALTLPSGAVRTFSGIVEQFSQGARGAKYTSYGARLVPRTWLLTKRTTSRIFQQLSVPDILRHVLADPTVDFQLQGTFQPRNYCVQYRESDFAFASRLMEEEGIYYYFVHGSDGHHLVVADTPQSHPDAGAVAFDPNAKQKSSSSVYQWEKEQEVSSGKVTLRDHNFQLPNQSLEAQATIADSVQVGTVTHHLKLPVNGDLEDYDFPGRYAQRFDGIDAGGGDRSGELQKIFVDAAHTAAVRMEQEAAAGLRISGAATARQLAAGQRFMLQGHFNADGPYVLTSVEHSAQVANVESGDLTYTSSFTCIPAALPYRPPRSTPRPVVAGHQTAVVVGPAGEEIFTDKYGRVKVQFFWDREGKKDASSSCWVRIGAQWAGQPFGVISVPRIGQEVVVAFEEGDPDRPIIVGTVFDAEHMPPTPWPPPRTQ